MEEAGDSSGEWQGGTYLPTWGVKRLETGLPRQGSRKRRLEKEKKDISETEEKQGQEDEMGGKPQIQDSGAPRLKSMRYCWVVPGEGSIACHLECSGKVPCG
jgi:hypothetical protein